MSQFIEKLKEIKKETFHLNDFYTQELVEIFDFKNDDDKNFILWNNQEIKNYKDDIYNLLNELIKNWKLKNYENEIIENYKSKYINNNSIITRDYSLNYIWLLAKYYKEKDYKILFRELYDSNNDLFNKFIFIFINSWDEEYFIKAFNQFLSEKTKYWNKYFSTTFISFLLDLKDENFKLFINELKSDWLVYFTEFKLKDSKNFIKKLNKLNDADLNNNLKNLLLQIVDKLTDKKKYDYDEYEINQKFFKNDFCKELTKYLWKIFKDLSLDLTENINNLFYWYWEIIHLISSILNKENIKTLIKNSWENFFDVYIYENIDWWNRTDKSKLLEEFKKYEDFNKKLNQRKEILNKSQLEQEERQNKEKEKFLFWISNILEQEKNDPKWISEYLLYHFDENIYQLQENKEVEEVIKNQVKRFFNLEYSNPELYELKYTKKDDNSTSYTTHQFVVNHTFLRCLKFYKQFWFEINSDIKKKTIKYIPFAYSNDLETIFSILWNSELEKDDIDYLLGIYDWSRPKDELRYHNISSFTYFYEKYKDNFIKYSKNETQNTFIKIINDENYKSYERQYTTEKLADIWEEKQLFELFKNYKSDENYFSNIDKLTIPVICWKAIIKSFQKSKNKKEIIEWFIKQLKEAKVSFNINFNDSEFHSVSWLEDEFYWDLKEEKSFISIFKYINDLNFESDIKELLNYSFKIISESNDYKIYWNYLQQAVFNFYEGIKNKNLKTIFELEKEVSEKVSDDESRILFKINFLDKLINIYSENIEPSKINNIYKSVYKVEINNKKENELLRKRINFLEEITKKINIPLIITEWKTDWKILLWARNNLDIIDKKEYNFNFNDFIFKYEDENRDFWWDTNIKVWIKNLTYYFNNIEYYKNKLVIWIFDTDSSNLKEITDLFKNKDGSEIEINKLKVNWWYWIHKHYNNLYSLFIPLPEHRKKFYEKYWCCIELYFNNENLKWKLLTKCMISELKNKDEYKLITWEKEGKLVYDNKDWIWYKDSWNNYNFTDFNSSFTEYSKNDFSKEVIHIKLDYKIRIRFKLIFNLIDEIIEDSKKSQKS